MKRERRFLVTPSRGGDGWEITISGGKLDVPESIVGNELAFLTRACQECVDKDYPAGTRVPLLNGWVVRVL